MNFSKDITGFLPPPLAKLLQDDAAVKDMLIALTQADKALETARKSNGSNKELQGALNDIVGVLPLIRTILEKKGKVSFGDAPRIMNAFMNKAKYEAASEVIADAFKAGDPVTISLAQTLVADKALLDAVKRVAPKLLPPDVQPLLQDKEIASDMFLVIGEMEKALESALKDPATDKGLKEAFNDVSKAASAMHGYLETGTLAPSLISEFALNIDKYKKSGKLLSDSFEAGDPAIEGLRKSLRENEKILGALKRVVPKTHGTLFKLECDAEGQGYAVELLSGNAIKFPLDKADYEEIKSAIPDSKSASKPKPPKAPGV